MKSIGIEAISYTGTTLLSMILGSHPRCKSVGHCYVFFNPYRKKKKAFHRKCDICDLLEKNCDLELLIDQNADAEDAYNLIDTLILKDGEDTIIDCSSTTPWFELSRPDTLIWTFREPVSLASSYKKRGLRLSYMVKAYLKKYTYASGLVIDYGNIIKETGHLKGLFKALGLEYSSDYLEYWKYENHAISGNKGVLLNYAKHHCPEKAEHVIAEISAGNKDYEKYYRDAEGNFDGSIDILDAEEKIYIQRTCGRLYDRLKDMEACLI